MNTFPWAVNNDYNVAPAESFAGGQYTGMNQMDCVSTEPGCLEQQYPVAMAYVPWQEWRSLYEVEKGFRCGTIFAELNLPFCWKGGAAR